MVPYGQCLLVCGLNSVEHTVRNEIAKIAILAKKNLRLKLNKERTETHSAE